MTAFEARCSEASHEFLQGEHRLCVAQIAGNRGYPLARNPRQPIRDEIKSFPPIDFTQLAVAADVWPIEPPADQPVARETGLVGNPFFVDRLVQARQDAQYLRSAGIDPDVAADRVEDIYRFGLLQLPGPGNKGIGL